MKMEKMNEEFKVEYVINMDDNYNLVDLLPELKKHAKSIFNGQYSITGAELSVILAFAKDQN